VVESGRTGTHTPFFRFLASPIMIAIITGMAVSLARITLPAPLLQALQMLGETSIPIMLFALGVRMIDVSLRSWRIGLAGAVVCPAAGLAIAWLLDQLLTLTAGQRGQMYLFAALPPAVFCFIVAEKYRQEPDKVAAIVLLGNLAALVFVPVGLWLGLRSG
jgi:predicted permease